MEFENRFEVPLPPDQAWKLLLDVPRIAPCLPGAELTEALGENRYKGKVSVKLGPVALSFNGTAQLSDIDEAAHTARIQASGNDTKGRGNASAKVSFRLEPSANGSLIVVRTDLTLAGMVAQYGRGAGMIQTIADQLIGQFVVALKTQLARAPAASAEIQTAAAEMPAMSEPVAAKPISAFALLWTVLKAKLKQIFG
jgi:carbon monoxide dehydrogenase subunit G